MLDLSCRKRKGKDTAEGEAEGGTDEAFYVVTNKWTKYTDFVVRYVDCYQVVTSSVKQSFQ